MPIRSCSATVVPWNDTENPDASRVRRHRDRRPLYLLSLASLRTDVQLKGPYTLWRHTHTFEERNHGTLCLDRVFRERRWTCCKRW